MIEGIKIEFNKENNNYFENQQNNDIDTDLLIISLLETINDICKEKGLNANEKLENYIKMGSVDNYNTEEEIKLKNKYKTFQKVSDFMTKEIKNILKKDLKKYETLVNVTEGEAQEIYMEVVMFFQELINE